VWVIARCWVCADVNFSVYWLNELTDQTHCRLGWVQDCKACVEYYFVFLYFFKMWSLFAIETLTWCTVVTVFCKTNDSHTEDCCTLLAMLAHQVLRILSSMYPECLVLLCGSIHMTTIWENKNLSIHHLTATLLDQPNWYQRVGSSRQSIRIILTLMTVFK